MFSNKESGWKRTEELNQGGPKTKAEVDQEVVDKYEKERKLRETGYRNHSPNYQQDNKQAKSHRGDQRGDRRNETQAYHTTRNQTKESKYQQKLQPAKT